MLLIHNVICVILLSIGLLFPDLFLGYYKGILSCTIPVTTLFSIIGFASILSFVKNLKFLYILITLIIIAQCIQINHWTYFGAPIHSQDISKVFFEIDEIFQTGISNTKSLWPAWFSITFMATLLYISITTPKKRFHLPYMSLVAIVCLSINPALSFIKGPSFFYTKPTASTIYNTSRAFSDWLVNSRPYSPKIKFKPYQITYSKPLVKNIVFILGESQSSRYMQLYGYTKPNTPFLESLKNDANFAYTKGISSSVSTITALQLFFNNFYNPGFIELIRNKSANLFRLARHQGYKTFIISGQNEKLFHDTGTEFVDYFVFEKTLREQQLQKGDEALLDSFANLEFSDKNFIVIHLRHIHSPFGDYAKYLPEQLPSDTGNSRTNQTQKEYATAIAYNDYWVKKCIDLIKAKLPKDTVIIFTSDHGELVGEEGLFGHNLMRPEVADVPIWSYALNADTSLNNYLKSQSVCSHYDLSKQIAHLMGAEIINPNENDSLQFVHGTELQANYEVMPWKKTNNKAEFFQNQRVDDILSRYFS